MEVEESFDLRLHGDRECSGELDSITAVHP
jgi:hypothetical protein